MYLKKECRIKELSRHALSEISYIVLRCVLARKTRLFYLYIIAAEVYESRALLCSPEHSAEYQPSCRVLNMVPSPDYGVQTQFPEHRS